MSFSGTTKNSTLQQSSSNEPKRNIIYPTAKPSIAPAGENPPQEKGISELPSSRMHLRQRFDAQQKQNVSRDVKPKSHEIRARSEKPNSTPISRVEVPKSVPQQSTPLKIQPVRSNTGANEKMISRSAPQTSQPVQVKKQKDSKETEKEE